MTVPHKQVDIDTFDLGKHTFGNYEESDYLPWIQVYDKALDEFVDELQPPFIVDLTCIYPYIDIIVIAGRCTNLYVNHKDYSILYKLNHPENEVGKSYRLYPNGTFQILN